MSFEILFCNSVRSYLNLSHMALCHHCFATLSYRRTHNRSS